MKKYLLILLFVILTFNLKSQILNVEGNRFYNDSDKISSVIKFNHFFNNTDKKVTSLSSMLHLQYKDDSTALYLVIFDFNRMTSGNVILDDYRVGHLRYNHKITKRITYEFFIQALYNYTININCRTDIGTGLRIKSIHQGVYKVYNGFLIMKENYFNNYQSAYTNNYRYDFYISFNLNIEKNLYLTNTTYYQPKINEFSNYRILNESTLTLKVFKHFALEESVNFMTQNVKPKDVSASNFLNKISLILLF